MRDPLQFRMLQKFISLNAGACAEPARVDVVRGADELLAPTEAPEIPRFANVGQLVLLDDDLAPARQIFFSLCKQNRYD